jgi:hypothetical protein
MLSWLKRIFRPMTREEMITDCFKEGVRSTLPLQEIEAACKLRNWLRQRVSLSRLEGIREQHPENWDYIESEVDSSEVKNYIAKILPGHNSEWREKNWVRILDLALFRVR